MLHLASPERDTNIHQFVQLFVKQHKQLYLKKNSRKTNSVYYSLHLVSIHQAGFHMHCCLSICQSWSTHEGMLYSLVCWYIWFFRLVSSSQAYWKHFIFPWALKQRQVLLQYSQICLNVLLGEQEWSDHTRQCHFDKKW